MSEFIEEIPDSLKSLVTRLEALSKTGAGSVEIEDELMPDLSAVGFRMLTLVARGGMGLVYLAEQISLERKVAVKVLSERFARGSKEWDKFHKEAKLIALLDHPGIVKVISAGEHGSRSYYAMEIVRGSSLDHRRFLDARRLAQVMEKVADAIEYAHSQGVLHRDLKPGNVFIDHRGNVKVGDFGIAAFSDEEAFIEDCKSQSGTLDYMAPERKEKGENSVRTDIYSFGVMLNRLLKDSEIKSKALTAIAKKASAQKAEERYASMGEVLDDLRRYLRDEPVKAMRPGIVCRFGLWIKRNPVYALIMTATLVVFMLLCVVIRGMIVSELEARKPPRRPNPRAHAYPQRHHYPAPGPNRPFRD